MIQNAVHLHDVRVGPEDVLGELGQGMRIAQDIMEFGRVCIAATAVGVMTTSAPYALSSRIFSCDILSGSTKMHR